MVASETLTDFIIFIDNTLTVCDFFFKQIHQRQPEDDHNHNTYFSKPKCPKPWLRWADEKKHTKKGHTTFD